MLGKAHHALKEVLLTVVISILYNVVETVRGINFVVPRSDSVSMLVFEGQIRRVSQKNKKLHDLKVKKVMTKNPIKVDKNMLAMKALSIMNENKITILCVNHPQKKNKTIGILHIHNILDNGID